MLRYTLSLVQNQLSDQQVHNASCSDLPIVLLGLTCKLGISNLHGFCKLLFSFAAERTGNV